jgi:hypothetical protein
MHATRFDTITRSLITGSSRRTLFAGLAAAVGATVLARSEPALARKKNKKKLKFNAFGCVNVEGKCRGNDANCCSNICEGKKPKKGKKDKSRCVGHDGGSCQAGQDSCLAGGSGIPCTTDTGHSGSCLTTTGAAEYCGRKGGCFACAKDADCVPFCGLHAACVVCVGCSDEVGTDTACNATGTDGCDFGPP